MIGNIAQCTIRFWYALDNWSTWVVSSGTVLDLGIGTGWGGYHTSYVILTVPSMHGHVPRIKCTLPSSISPLGEVESKNFT